MVTEKLPCKWKVDDMRATSQLEHKMRLPVQ